MSRHRVVETFTAVALFGLLLGGCATGDGRGTVKALVPADAPALAGLWQGSLTVMSGVSSPATLTVNADQTYIIRAGAFTAQGKAEIQEGRLEFISTATSGVGSTGSRIGTAVVLDRGDAWGLVGSGQSPAGPYNFEFSRRR